jgi:hypothetical protein
MKTVLRQAVPARCYFNKEEEDPSVKIRVPVKREETQQDFKIYLAQVFNLRNQ